MTIRLGGARSERSNMQRVAMLASWAKRFPLQSRDVYQIRIAARIASRSIVLAFVCMCTCAAR
jgi:hypothetical protein